jgi:hypothetical protein
MAADPQYYFRYRTIIADRGVVPEQPQEADITARFVGVVGFPFSEPMPLVSGKSFSSWKVSSGSLPEGLSFDEGTGAVAGTPTLAGKGAVILASGFGPDGAVAGSARIEIDVFKPVDGYRAVDFYGHTNHYDFEQLDVPAGTTVDHWNVIYAPPPGVAIIGRNYDGTPTKAGRYPVAVRGFDYLDREIILLTGYYLVEDGPTFPRVADDVRPIPSVPGYQLFNDWAPYVRPVDPSAQPGMRFDVEVNAGDVLPGTIQGVPKIGLVTGGVSLPYQRASIRWKATDTDGTVGYSNWWRIGTSNPQPDFSAGTLGPFRMTVGQFSEILFGTVGTPGTKSFSLLEGTLPEGLTLDAANGIIKGTPVKDEKQEGIRLHLAVANGANLDEKDSVPFTIQVDKAEVGLRVAEQSKNDVRVGESFSATLERLGDVVQPATVAVDPATPLPDGVTFDPASLRVSGKVATSGQNVWRFVLNNGDGRVRDISVRLGVYAPLSVTATDVTIPQYESKAQVAKVEWPSDAVMPSATGASPTFSVVGSLPRGVKLDPYAGTISGGTIAPMGRYGPFAVQIADGSGQTALSASFFVDVTERLPLGLAAEGLTFHSGLQQDQSPVVSLTRPQLSNFMHLVWSLDGVLPPGLAFDPETGRIAGAATSLATYPGLTLSVRDEDGTPYAASAPFSVTVVEASPIQAKYSPPVRWTVGQPLVIQVPAFLNTIGSVTYSAQGELPSGMSIDASTGAVSGTPSSTFDGVIEIVATDSQGRTGVASTKTTILPPPSVEALGLDLQVARLENKSFKVTTTNLVGSGDFRIVTGALPDGFSFSRSTGAIAGTAMTEGKSSDIVVGVTDVATGVTATTDRFTITVVPRKAINVAYANALVYDDLPYNMPLKPVVSNAAPGSVAYSLVGALPPGVEFDTTSGWFTGQPTLPGLYPVDVAATDADGSTSSTPVTIHVSRYYGLVGPSALAGGTWRIGQQVTTPSPGFSNAIGPVVYASFAAEPVGLQMDPATGVFSGVLSSAGEWFLQLNGADADGRVKWGSNTFVTLAAKDHLSMTTAPATAVTTQYPAQPLDVRNVVANGIGTLAYSISGTLPRGVTLDPATGTISGRPQQKGVFANLVLTATDPYDGDVVSSAPFSIVVNNRVPLTATLPAVATTLANHDVKQIAKPVVTGAANGAPVTYAYVGTLPPGVSFDVAAGTFHGEATALGDWPGITVTVTDALGTKASSGPMTIRSVLDGEAITLEVGDIVTKVGFPFSTGVPTTENTIGTPRFYSYDVVPQIRLDEATGEMTGVFTSVQDFDFDLYVGDETSRATSERIKVQVLPALRIVAPTTVFSRQADPVAQAVDIFYKAGTANYSRGSGVWPEGVSVDPSTGAIVGTPSAAVGDYTGLTIRGVDSFGAGNADTQFSNVFTIKVQQILAVPVISNVAGNRMVYGTVGQIGIPFGPTVVDSRLGKPWTYGGTVYSLNHALPAGLSFDTTTGRISGTPVEAAIIEDLVITVTSGAGDVASTAPFWFGVQPAGAITPSADQRSNYVGRVGATFTTEPPLFDNVFGPVSYQMLNGVGRGTFNATTGVYTHPTYLDGDVGTWPLIVVVTDAFGRTGMLTMQEVVSPGMGMTIPKASVPVAPGLATTALNANVPIVTGAAGTLSFTGTGLPPGTTIDATTGALTGVVPTGVAHGTKWTVTVTARDTVAGLFIEKSATYSVTAVIGSYQYWRVADNQTVGYPYLGQYVMGGFYPSSMIEARDGLPLTDWFVMPTPPLETTVWAWSGSVDGAHVNRDASGWAWKGWKFPVPVDLGTLGLANRNDWTACNTQMQHPTLQHSTDGVTWTTAKAADWPSCQMNLTFTLP